MATKFKIRKHGTGWRPDIFVKLPSGKRIRERPVLRNVTKTAAKEWAEERIRQILDPAQREQEALKDIPTILAFKDDFIKHQRSNQLKASTIYAKEKIYSAHLIPLLGHRRLDTISRVDGEMLKNELGDCGRKTVNNVLTVLSTALKAAQDLGHIPEDRKIPRFARTNVKYEGEIGPNEFYDFEQYGRMLRTCDRLDARIRAAILVSGDAGLRPGEVVALEWPDLGKAPAILRVQRQVWYGRPAGETKAREVVDTPKGGRGRTVPMTARLAAALAALPVRRLDTDRVFLQDDGVPLTAKVLRRWMRTAQRAAALHVNGNVKMLRHTFASHLAMRGKALLVIQRLCGHVSITTTMRYSHLAPGGLERDAIDSLESTSPAGTTPALST